MKRAVFVVMLAATSAHGQTNTTTDRITRCETDANDVTTCTTAPNYAEELRRAEQDRARELEANQRYWHHVDELRRKGEQHVADEGKQK